MCYLQILNSIIEHFQNVIRFTQFFISPTRQPSYIASYGVFLLFIGTNVVFQIYPLHHHPEVWGDDVEV